MGGFAGQIGITVPSHFAALVAGDPSLPLLTQYDDASGERTELHPNGVFVFIGLTPNTAFAQKLVDTDERGFIQTDGILQTSVEGIFAAGDCRAGSTKQAASAAGEGAAAALAIRRYVEACAEANAGTTSRPAELAIA